MIHEEHAVMPHSGLLTEALQHLFYKQKTEKVIKVLIQETGACTHRGMAVEADMGCYILWKTNDNFVPDDKGLTLKTSAVTGFPHHLYMCCFPLAEE